MVMREAHPNRDHDSPPSFIHSGPLVVRGASMKDVVMSRDGNQLYGLTALGTLRLLDSCLIKVPSLH